jgi:hypothetical protein
VYNNTTGAYTVTLRVTGQTGVAVPQKRAMTLYCDGVDVRRRGDAAAVLARSSDTMLGAGQFGATIVATGTWTQTLDAAATLGVGWMCYYRNDGTGVVTIDPNGAETIDGAATIALPAGASCVILCDGAALKSIGRAQSVKRVTRQVFTSGSGTYTTPAGATRINVRLVGAGGGGGASNTNAGASGGDTTFGTLTGGGGAGGSASSTSAAAGGTATGGDINFAGSGGHAGFSGDNSSALAAGGPGGASAFGGAGAAGASGTAGGAAAANTGSGGGGAGQTAQSCGGGGGSGGYVEKLILAPSATYAYAVGAGGNGAAAGGQAGGNGAAGIIIVDEFYD